LLLDEINAGFARKSSSDEPRAATRAVDRASIREC